MKISKSFGFDASTHQYAGEYDEPTVCPLCKYALKPHELGIYTYKNNQGLWIISAQYLCEHCFQTFLAVYECTLEPNPANRNLSKYKSKLLYIGPSKFDEEHFDKGIEDLSPQFVKIYNQALSAESSGLDEIAGLGYRKALEFLAKDFCIRQSPNEAETIKKMPLGKCITTFVQNDQIQTLALRAAWIGNDEAHYVRKQEDRDITDMKAFIRAMVYFIGMVLIAEDASSMSPV